MPLEYIYTFAQYNCDGSGGGGFVYKPKKKMPKTDKMAEQILQFTRNNDYCVDNRPFYAFTKYKHSCSLTRTFAIEHYLDCQPVRFSHIMFLDPLERAYFSEGPVYAMKRLRFKEEFGRAEDWPDWQKTSQVLPDKEPQQVPNLSTWEALTGDRGWCGWCIERILEGKTLCWVYDPEKTNGSEEILNLLDELFQLLPAERRWSVTFNTRVDIPTQTSFKILCVEDDYSGIIPEIRSRKGQRLEVVELHNLSQSPPSTSAWVEYARTGKVYVNDYEDGLLEKGIVNDTQVELLEKFKSICVQCEELDEAADVLLSADKQLREWEKILDGRKRILEGYSEGLGIIWEEICARTREHRDLQKDLQKRMYGFVERMRDRMDSFSGELGEKFKKVRGIIDDQYERFRRENENMGGLQKEMGERQTEFVRMWGVFEKEWNSFYGRAAVCQRILNSLQGEVREGENKSRKCDEGTERKNL
ncbi:MAG: hypothetical protein IJQ31_00225 [Thermoguttaceae bacterium]|nr:hypothetical protein [Thermoguttaceae bacterium]